MALHFPEVEDVRFLRAPLVEVVCQVRFPKNLSITQAPPVQLQKLISHRFPEYGDESGFQLSVNVTPEQTSSDIQTAHTGFFFLTADQTSRVFVSADAYAVSTAAYTVWDDFAADLELAHRSINEAYGIPYAKRVGLRYINQISMSEMNLSSASDLMGLLRPELTDFFRNDAWQTAETGFSQVTIRNEDGSALGLRVTFNENGADPTVFLDLDYYQEGRIDLSDLVKKCNEYHDTIYRAFRWSLNPDQIGTFEPQEGSTIQ